MFDKDSCGPWLDFHAPSHTFASCWMMAGGELYALKDILGHKTIAMTQRYAHLSPAYRRSMVDRMEQIWAKPASQLIGPTVVKGIHANGRRHGSVSRAAVPLSALLKSWARSGSTFAVSQV